MPITRKLIAQDENDVNQWLRVDHDQRYIVNDSPEWQFLFGPNSVLTNSSRVLKISGQFDTSDLDSVRFISYLYNPVTGGIDNATSCSFNIYKVDNGSSWTETLLDTFTGTLQANQYFYADRTLASLSPADLTGDTSLMVEVVVTRLTETYRDRIYLNHLGIYDSFLRLKQDVEYLDLTKQDE